MENQEQQNQLNQEEINLQPNPQTNPQPEQRPRKRVLSNLLENTTNYLNEVKELIFKIIPSLSQSKESLYNEPEILGDKSLEIFHNAEDAVKTQLRISPNLINPELVVDKISDKVRPHTESVSVYLILTFQMILILSLIMTTFLNIEIRERKNTLENLVEKVKENEDLERLTYNVIRKYKAYKAIEANQKPKSRDLRAAIDGVRVSGLEITKLNFTEQLTTVNAVIDEPLIFAKVTSKYLNDPVVKNVVLTSADFNALKDGTVITFQVNYE